MTLTLPHGPQDRLKPLLDALYAGRSRAFSGAHWKAEREAWGIVGGIWALEITHGTAGWHPHVHVLLFTTRRLKGFEVDGLADAIWRRWAEGVRRGGGRWPTRAHGIDVRRAHGPSTVASSIGAYLTGHEPGATWSIGLEVARGDLKAGRRGRRNMGQILADVARHGDAADLALWREYEKATFKRRVIVWSPGLATALGVNQRSDDDIVNEDRGGVVVGVLTCVQWGTIIRRGLLVELLDRAELYGAPGVAELVRCLTFARAGP